MMRLGCWGHWDGMRFRDSNNIRIPATEYVAINFGVSLSWGGDIPGPLLQESSGEVAAFT